MLAFTTTLMDSTKALTDSERKLHQSCNEVLPSLREKLQLAEVAWVNTIMQYSRPSRMSSKVSANDAGEGWRDGLLLNMGYHDRVGDEDAGSAQDTPNPDPNTLVLGGVLFCKS